MPEPARSGATIPRRALLVALLVVAAAYLPGLSAGFAYDDHGTIVENDFLAAPANLGRVLTLRTLSDPYVIDGQRPLLLVTSFLDRAVWGLRPFGWHLTSLLLHLLMTALVYRLCRAAACGDRAALLAALLFGLHPALSEAVQLPSYREDLLAGVCVMAYMLDILRGRTGRPLAWFALALLAKESAFAAPGLALAAWALRPGSRPPRRAMLLHLAGCALLAAAFSWAAFHARPLQAANVAWNGYSLRWPDNLARAPGVFALYLRLLAWPWPLCADRAVPALPAAAGLLALAGGAALAWWLRARRPYVALGLAWIALAFVPVSNLLPLFNPVGERYLYLMAPGLALALAALLPDRPAGGRGAAAALGVAVVFLGLVPLRLRDWRGDAALWASVLRVNPASARAHTWLGLEAKHRGERVEAARLFAQAEALNPQDIAGLVNLAILDGEAGRLPEAEARLRTALARRPDRADVWANLAQALRLQGRHDEAARAEAERAKRQPRW